MTVKLFKFTAYAEEEFSLFHTSSLSLLVNYRQVTKRSCVNRTFSKILVNIYSGNHIVLMEMIWLLSAVYKAPLLSSFSMFITVYGKVPQIFPWRSNLLQSWAPTLIKLTYLWVSNDLEDSAQLCLIRVTAKLCRNGPDLRMPGLR